LRILKRGWFFLLFSALTTACGAEVSPVALTFFGLYGEPVYPPALAVPSSDGFGFNFLAEWNATSYTSLGLGFEQIAFQGASTVPMLNFEGRIFPLENEKGKFSPYIYGGAGLNLSSGAWEGPVQLKAGIGSRVSIAGPVYFDLAVGSHWLQPPNDFQYVDIRYGLSLSLSSSGKPQESKPTATAVPAVVPSATPVPSPTVGWTPTATEVKSEPSPTEVVSQPEAARVEAAPVTTLAGVKKYYKLGMKAFLDGKYTQSQALLKKSLASKEIHGAKYYYAETYATLGVIYQFHNTEKNHKKTALIYYGKALKIDPATKSAKHYYGKLKAELKPKSKAKPKVKPAEDSPGSGASGSEPQTQSAD